MFDIVCDGRNPFGFPFATMARGARAIFAGASPVLALALGGSPFSELAKGWCGRGDSNPHRPCGPTDFLTSYGFRRRPKGVCGLDYPFTVLRVAEDRCCPSSLYTFPLADAAGLGSGLPFYRVPRI